MTDTITREQAVALALTFGIEELELFGAADIENLCKAAIQHYIDQQAALAAPQPEGDAERQERDMVTAYDLFSNLKLHGEYAALKVAFGSLWPAAFSHGFQTAKVIYKPEPQPVKQADLAKQCGKRIRDLALELEKTGRIISCLTVDDQGSSQERTDMVARNRGIQCAMEDAINELVEMAQGATQ